MNCTRINISSCVICLSSQREIRYIESEKEILRYAHKRLLLNIVNTDDLKIVNCGRSCLGDDAEER